MSMHMKAMSMRIRVVAIPISVQEPVYTSFGAVISKYTDEQQIRGFSEDMKNSAVLIYEDSVRKQNMPTDAFIFWYGPGPLYWGRIRGCFVRETKIGKGLYLLELPEEAVRRRKHFVFEFEGSLIRFGFTNSAH